LELGLRREQKHKASSEMESAWKESNKRAHLHFVADSAEIASRKGRDGNLSLEAGERWYVARSLPRQETRAEFELLRQGFPVFLPRATKTVRHARKLRTVKCPVFPSYMFVVLDIDRDRWRSVNGTSGVASLIMQGETPQPVPAGVVENLLHLTDEDGIVCFNCDLRQGQPVRVVAGPFANAIGTLERLDANGRVRVLLDLMNSKVPTYLDRSALEAT
jgi:transcription elongation factor/antiterminator RfaH